jgi:hypothetical protein
MIKYITSRLTFLMSLLLFLIVLSFAMPMLVLAAAASVTPVAPPTLVLAVNGSDVQLTWTAPTKNTDGTTPAKIAGYNIYRQTAPNIVTAMLGGAAPWVGKSPAQIMPTTLTYKDVGGASASWYYAVTAWYCDAPGCSESAVSTVVNKSATSVAGSASFSWLPPTQNSDGTALTDLHHFNIYRGASCSALAVVKVVAASINSFVDSGLPLGSYCYALTAVNVPGLESTKSGTLSVVFNPPRLVTPPNAPGTPQATCTMVAPPNMKATCTVTP